MISLTGARALLVKERSTKGRSSHHHGLQGPRAKMMNSTGARAPLVKERPTKGRSSQHPLLEEGKREKH